MRDTYQYPDCPPGANLLRLLYGWDLAIAAAYRGDTTMLCQYLESKNRPISDRGRRLLAKLLRDTLHKTSERGPKVGNLPASLHEAEAIVEARVRALLRDLRRGRASGRVAKGTVLRLVKEQKDKLMIQELHPKAAKIDVVRIVARVNGRSSRTNLPKKRGISFCD